jgi:ABC-2 type transport system ATP-binding protein
MTVLELHSIHKSFRHGFLGLRAGVLKGLDLGVERGEVYGFLGHNGAGKSTTMKVILGLLRPDQGRVLIFGENGASERTRARIGYLGEEVGLYPSLTAREMLTLVGDLFRLPRAVTRARADVLIEQAGLAEARATKIKHYSKGMRQRLGLATALMNDPELLILDEPYTGLDPIGRKELRELLVSLKARGKTIMMSSHVVADVEAVCDRVGILAGGKLNRVLDLNEVYRSQTGEVEVTIAGIDPQRFSARDYGARATFARERLVVVRMNGDQRLRSLVDDVYAAQGAVMEIKPLRTRLEDVFVEAVKTPADASTPGSKTELEPELSRR